MKKETVNSNKTKSFEELLAKRRELSECKKNNFSRVSAGDSQLNDVIANFNEKKQYEKRFGL